MHPSEACHPLKYKWTLYFNDPPQNSKRTINKDDWKKALHTIAHFDTIESFWQVCHNIPQPSDIPNKSAYYFFHYGIHPAWEEEANKGGGRFLYRFQQAAQRYEDESIFFDMTLLIMCNQFPGCEYLNGVGFNKEKSRLEVWMRKGIHQSRQDDLKKEMAEMLTKLFTIKNSKIKLKPQDFQFANF